jgi:hypothetical protein
MASSSMNFWEKNRLYIYLGITLVVFVILEIIFL